MKRATTQRAPDVSRPFKRRGLFLLVLATASGCWGKEVKEDGMIKADDFPSLQHAADAAEFGSTILLGPRRYDSVDLGDKSLSLIGAGPVSYTHLDVYKRQPQAK